MNALSTRFAKSDLQVFPRSPFVQIQSIVHRDLSSVWFVLVGVLFTGYAILDGFDLGVGPLVFSRSNPELSQTIYNAVSSHEALSVMACIGCPLVLM
jgi:cytochrome bd-type quinol oxidase subunit 2